MGLRQLHTHTKSNESNTDSSPLITLIHNVHETYIYDSKL